MADEIFDLRLRLYWQILGYKIGQELEGEASLLRFVDDLFEEYPKQFAPMEIIKEVLLDTLHKDITKRLLRLLTASDLVALDILLKKQPNGNQIAEFFREKIPNLKQELSDVHSELRTVYLYRPS